MKELQWFLTADRTKASMNWSISGLISFLSLRSTHLSQIHKQAVPPDQGFHDSEPVLATTSPSAWNALHLLPRLWNIYSSFKTLRELPPAWSLCGPSLAPRTQYMWLLPPLCSLCTLWNHLLAYLHNLSWHVSPSTELSFLRKGLMSNSSLNLQHPAQWQGHGKDQIVTVNIFWGVTYRMLF